jgi:hypothetical protein
VVLFVSTDLLVVYLWRFRGRIGRRRPRPEAAAIEARV